MLRVPLFKEHTLGYAFADIYSDDKIVLHSEITVDATPSVLKECKEVSDLICLSLKEKGAEEVFTWGITEEQERYNIYLGFFPTGKEVYLNGYTGDPIFEYKRILN